MSFTSLYLITVTSAVHLCGIRSPAANSRQLKSQWELENLTCHPYQNNTTEAGNETWSLGHKKKHVVQCPSHANLAWVETFTPKWGRNVTWGGGGAGECLIFPWERSHMKVTKMTTKKCPRKQPEPSHHWREGTPGQHFGELSVWLQVNTSIPCAHQFHSHACTHPNVSKWSPKSSYKCASGSSDPSSPNQKPPRCPSTAELISKYGIFTQETQEQWTHMTHSYLNDLDGISRTNSWAWEMGL